VAALLAHVESFAPRVQGRHRVGERARLLGREEAGEEQVAVAVELFELFLRQSHGCLLGSGGAADWSTWSSRAARFSPACWLCSSIRRAAASPSSEAIACAIASCSSQTA